ncbi:MAG: YigZ family protein [Bacilli bacterium]|nr:YigZ family protein [Bacilli bacterium]
MKKLIKNSIYTQTIKKSVFITNLIPVDSVDIAKNQLKEIKKKYYDATHNCYCYIITNENDGIKYSDDGEPSQTAGIVIYNVLEKNELTNILAVVTRYYGGIKLGAGGLIRAYSSSTSEALKIALIEDIIDYHYYKIKTDYETANTLIRYLENYSLIEKKFQTKVSLIYKINPSEKDDFLEQTINYSKGKAEVLLLKIANQ